MAPKRNKYGAVRTHAYGRWFASRHEAVVYGLLVLRANAGQISGLECQVPYRMRVNDVQVCTYIADFRYYEGSQLVVADAKGVRTDVYRLKRKLMKALYGIEVLEL